MRLAALYLTLPLLLANTKIHTQETMPPFGSYTSDELNMKECAFDKDADAIVLLDEASSDYG